MADCSSPLVRSKRASTKSNASSVSSGSSLRSRLGVFSACFGDPAEEQLRRLASRIRRGDTAGVERLLRKTKVSGRLLLTVKRRHLRPNFVAWSNRNQDPFVHFYQQCSPVVWAIDNQQWQMLPVLAGYGLDPNRPLTCRRWSGGGGACVVPYQQFWTKGRYTYQSALDYYFGSIFEFLGEDLQRMSTYSSPSSFFCFLQQLPQLLRQGVDVHRVDSVILFNCLGCSLNWYLTKYTNASNTVPDIPEHKDSCAEIFAVQSLLRAGFSQFDCLEFLSSSHNWFGILICLLCHPRLDQYEHRLPPLVQEAALLLINFLSLSSSHPSCEEVRDSLENLALRRLYSKRYSDRRQQFCDSLQSLQSACRLFALRPQPLRLLSRNALRRSLGGVNFADRLRQLPACPPEISAFVTYIGPSCLHLLPLPPLLLKLAKGENPFVEESQA